jgi:hypothetical protein
MFSQCPTFLVAEPHFDNCLGFFRLMERPRLAVRLDNLLENIISTIIPEFFGIRMVVQNRGKLRKKNKLSAKDRRDI